MTINFNFWANVALVLFVAASFGFFAAFLLTVVICLRGE